MHLVETSELPHQAVHISRGERMLRSPAIFRDVRWYSDRPLSYIGPAALQLMSEVIGAWDRPYQSLGRTVLRLLDGYLAITGQRLRVRAGKLSPRYVLQDCGGALYSEKFVFATDKMRANLLTRLRAIAVETNTMSQEAFGSVSTKGPTPFWDASRKEFEGRNVDPEQVELLRGWPVSNSQGGVRWFDLSEILKRYGREFAFAMQQSLQTFLRQRNQENVHGINDFLQYLAGLPPDWTREHFKRPFDVYELFNQYAIHYVESRADSWSYPAIQANWTKFCNVVKQCFTVHGAFATPDFDVPLLPVKTSKRPYHRLTSEGEVFDKLLSPVATEFQSDEEALQTFKILDADIATIRSWADGATANSWRRFEESRALAMQGRPRRIVEPSGRLTEGWTDINRPDWKQNVAATFVEQGFQTTATDKHLNLRYGRNCLTEASRFLALPGRGALLPHAALLVMDCPGITPALLTGIELFDDDHSVASLVDVDNQWVLDGHKLRRGVENAQQFFGLSERAKEVVRQVLLLTAPLREFLWKAGDPNWKKLFLSCGRAFATPRPVRFSKDVVGEHDRIPMLAKEFMTASALQADDAKQLARRFSLVSLRSTVITWEFVHDNDLLKASIRAGHKRFTGKDVEPYVPPAIVRHFEQVWVRRLQIVTLAVALKGSRFLLRATGFSSMDQCHVFLKEYGLNYVDNLEERAKSVKTETTEAIIAVDVHMLTVLESLRLAVAAADRQASPLALAWADFGERLSAYIEGVRPVREDLRVILEEAKAKASADIFKDIIHG
ncbi:hypothetical protein ACQKRQ_09260 [Paraburkholderia sp. NPDC080076]|uniref:hypothetical protein n=1 Tax=Paraburkholderia sp. NPDC080076 TaxID=3390605 RepID=UPI003CFC8387